VHGQTSGVLDAVAEEIEGQRCHQEHSHDTDLVPQARFVLDEGRNICTPSTHAGPIRFTNVSVIRMHM
jgi:hypothetical protein